MTDFARARKLMVDTQLRTSSITDRRLLAAMGDIPRELFVPADRRELAYIDENLTLKPGRSLSAPTPFGRLVQLAAIAPGDRVLDVGASSGYSTAVLAALAEAVVGIESDADLAAQAAANLSALSITNAHVRPGALDATGLREGQFDVIVIESVVATVPQALLAQLRDHGRLVALVGTGMTAVAHLFVKTGKSIAGRAEFNARLPALGDAAPATGFVF